MVQKYARTLSAKLNARALLKVERPLVSIVMPVSQLDQGFLRQSVESAMGQTLGSLELILVIDVPLKLLSPPVCETIGDFKADHRLRTIVNSKGGFVEALNAGVLAARGEYIARMDGDDISLPNRLELQVEAMETKNADLVGGWAHVIDEGGRTVGELTPPNDPRTIRKMIMVHNPFIHSSVMFRKSMLAHTGLYNPELLGAEDYELWMRTVSLGFLCLNLPRFLICLRETNTSIMRGKHWRSTRINYARAKALGVLKLGYHDPISIVSCLSTPFFCLTPPMTVLGFKSLVKWFRRGTKRDDTD